MEFRRLTSTDLKSLLELYKQLDADDTVCLSEQSEKVWKGIDAHEDIQYFGAVADGRVVSTCYAIYIPNLTRNNRGICFIENVVTDKEYRRLGLASQVLDMAIAFAKDCHCYKVILQSGSNRTEAHQFYEKKGSVENIRRRLICGWTDIFQFVDLFLNRLVIEMIKCLQIWQFI